MNRTCPERISGYSHAIGSFTFTTISARSKMVWPSSTRVAPAASYAASEKPAGAPAPRSISTVWPCEARDSASAGSMATRYSWVLVSRFVPMIITLSQQGGRG